jgi:glycosyltransferase involved in cell wall biosynthesis
MMISVIMPVFNGAATIVSAIASVLEQSHDNLELIVVNDGSTDATFSIVSAICDTRLRIINQENRGVSAARNAGLARSTGHYIAFIDADDIWVQYKLEKQRDALLIGEADVAYCWVDYINISGDTLHPDGRPRFEGNVYEQMLAHNFIHSGSNLLVTRAAYDRCGGFCDSLEAFEDWDFQLRLARHFTFACVPDVLAFYRMRNQSLTTRVLSMEVNYHRAAERAFREHSGSKSALRKKNEAVTYEYLMSRAVQGFPTRRKGKIALNFYYKAVRAWSAIVWHPHPKPWVIKRLLLATYWSVRPLSLSRRSHWRRDKLRRGEYCE